MTYADKIAEAPERIWAWEIDFDGWWDTEKPDWIETPVAYTRADLADAQAQEIARLREAVTVDVKPLEWRDLTYGMNPHWTANHPFGSIDIRQEDEDLEWRWVVRPFIGGRSNWPTLEEAKADAEADYRARVRASLRSAP